jgi:hypothetical protein
MTGQELLAEYPRLTHHDVMVAIACRAKMSQAWSRGEIACIVVGTIENPGHASARHTSNPV